MFVAAGSPGARVSGANPCTIVSGVWVVASIVGEGTTLGGAGCGATGETTGGGATTSAPLTTIFLVDLMSIFEMN